MYNFKYLTYALLLCNCYLQTSSIWPFGLLFEIQLALCILEILKGDQSNQAEQSELYYYSRLENAFISPKALFYLELSWGSFNNYVEQILPNFDHLHCLSGKLWTFHMPSVDFLVNTYLLTFSCSRRYSMTPCLKEETTEY